MEYAPELVRPRSRQEKVWRSVLVEFLRLFPNHVLGFLDKIKTNGVTASISNYDKSKLGIFNLLNFFQFITGMIVPFIGLFHTDKIPRMGWVMACLPALVSLVALLLNSYRKYEAAVLAYFIFYPICISFSYVNGLSLGVELSFILYGILSVFFIQDIGYMIFSICFSMVSYFVVSVLLTAYVYKLEDIHYGVYLINEILAILYIFFGLYLIKKENTSYNAELQQTNLEIQEQARRLQSQTAELNQANSFKNKLFSIISHDLKAPLYGLCNLFDTMQKQDMPARQIKLLIPDIKNDLYYARGLMENLLQWAKSQMQADHVRPQEMDIKDCIDEVLHVLHLQAKSKNIHIENKTTGCLYVWADKDMINLVLRNLISNAIKFTRPGDSISVGAGEFTSIAEIYVQDSGGGMTAEEINKINGQEFYTTHGTAQEQGTGLGLMLCKEFLVKNGSRLRIESEPGKGSIFSFALPLS
ncbi:MAG TPA: HAMP domain-containing sensor histidine kinase [Chitinophagaceae bacterium]|nr:HAMP domain-containing sensor histidine kinase [Chitinophagaceae bacterium]